MNPNELWIISVTAIPLLVPTYQSDTFNPKHSTASRLSHFEINQARLYLIQSTTALYIDRDASKDADADPRMLNFRGRIHSPLLFSIYTDVSTRRCLNARRKQKLLMASESPLMISRTISRNGSANVPRTVSRSPVARIKAPFRRWMELRAWNYPTDG